MFGKAPRGVSERPKVKTAPKAAIPSWLWLMVLVLAGICFMIFLFLWRPWQPSIQQPTAVASTSQQETNQDFRFYDLLPQQQVTPVPEQAIPEQKKTAQEILVIQAPTPPVEKTTDNITDPFDNTVTTASIPHEPKYILQIRSFEDPDQADARRAEIVLNGLSAEVIVTNEGSKIWYRVISGPYHSEDAVKIAQQALQNSGIDSFIVKQP